MAQADDDREERPELDSEGQPVLHLTLDQVLILAYQHARNNQEFYGQYADTELAWALDRAHETEDHYEIRLSYRPVRGFRGRPGIEQFIIPKAGGIEFRQIISKPRPIWRPPVLYPVIGTMVAIGAALGILFVTGVLPPSPTSPTGAQRVDISLKPDVPSRLKSDGVRVDIPADSVDGSSAMTYSPLSLSEIPALPASFRATDKIFDLTTDSPLLKPITITVEFSKADAELADSNEDNLVIQHHRDGAWVALNTKVDFGTSTAQVRVDHLSIFALAIKVLEPARTPLPTEAVIPEPLQSPDSTVPSALEAFRTGLSYYKEGRYDWAVDEFTAAIELDPNVRNYYWYRGLSYEELTDFDEAIEDYTTAIGLNPGSATLHALRGRAYTRDGQSEQALSDLNEAIRLNPNLAMAYYLRGDALAEVNQAQKAGADHARACQLDEQFCQ